MDNQASSSLTGSSQGCVINFGFTHHQGKSGAKCEFKRRTDRTGTIAADPNPVPSGPGPRPNEDLVGEIDRR